jgi:hypothetical protein
MMHEHLRFASARSLATSKTTIWLRSKPWKQAWNRGTRTVGRPHERREISVTGGPLELPIDSGDFS